MAASVLDAPVLHDLDDFLVWLHRKEGRFEFVEGRIERAEPWETSQMDR